MRVYMLVLVDGNNEKVQSESEFFFDYNEAKDMKDKRTNIDGLQWVIVEFEEMCTIK